jgi:uncharacterized protein (TIRG00374 family)
MSTPSGNDRKKNTRATILRALVSIVLLGILLSQVDWPEFFRVLANLKPVYILFPIVGFYINILLSTAKWKEILSYLGLKHRFQSLFTTYLIGVFFTNFLPTSFGGDGYRYLKLRREHNGASDRILSSLLLERGYGYITLLGVNLLLLAAFREVLTSSTLILWLEVLIGLMVFGLILVLWLGKGTVNRLVKWWDGFRFADKAWALLTIRDPRTIAISLITSLFFVLISGIGLGMYYRAAGVPLNWFYALYITTIIGIIGIAPITINGLGLVELVQSVLLGLVGVSLETVIAIALIQRVLGLILSIPGGILYFRRGMGVAVRAEGKYDGN